MIKAEAIGPLFVVTLASMWVARVACGCLGGGRPKTATCEGGHAGRGETRDL